MQEQQGSHTYDQKNKTKKNWLHVLNNVLQFFNNIVTINSISIVNMMIELLSTQLQKKNNWKT